MIQIPVLTPEELSELDILSKHTPKLDEKRVAIRQLIAEGSKLLHSNFDLIAYPLFSGIIPSALLNLLYNKIHGKGLPFYEFSAPSSLGVEQYSRLVAPFQIELNPQGEELATKISNELLECFNNNGLSINTAKILLIDANVAKGYTVYFFIKALEKIGYTFENLTFVVTDNRDEKVDKDAISNKLLHGGHFNTLNKTNMTNKVFDNVLTPSCNKKDGNIKKFVGTNVVFDYNQITFMPYYLAIRLFQEEYTNN